MTTQQDIIAAIDEADQRLHNLADRLRAYPSAPVQEGDWTIRDMLCHVAATSNYTALIGQVQRRGGVFPTPEELDETNRQQLAEHVDRSVDDLLAEASRGYAAAREAARQLTNEQLAKPGPSVPGGDSMTTGDLVAIVYRGHAHSHIATLEQALGTTR